MTLSRPATTQKMGPGAKRVFQGVVFDVYQWQQIGYDGVARTFEKLVRPDTVLIIPVMEDGTIMYSLQEQPGKNPFVGLFGGRVDAGEDALMAAKRELQEEAGCASSDWTLFSAVQPTSKIDWCIWTFVAKKCRITGIQQLDGAEKVEPRYATFDEFIDIVSSNEFEEDTLRTRVLEARLDSEKMRALRAMLS